MSAIPDDIMQAAYDCARGIYLNVDDAGAPYMTDSDIEEFAKAILFERQSAKAMCDEMAKEARRQALEEVEKISEREYKRHCTGSGFDSQPARSTAYTILNAIRSLAKAKEADHG